MWAEVLVRPPTGDPYVITVSATNLEEAERQCEEIAARERDEQKHQ